MAVISQAVSEWDAGNQDAAAMALSKRRNTLSDALQSRQVNCPKPRIEAKASAHVARLEPGFRVLDSTAQIAPLLGLFGIVLGMIDAFQALQQAGNSVDPSLLAGGIWVALLTTAAGLAVAMPTSLVLTFFDSRVRANGYWSKARLKPNRSTRGLIPMALQTAKLRGKKLSMTSLIDVIFLLLLFFMLSSTFTRFSEIPLVAASAGQGAISPDTLQIPVVPAIECCARDSQLGER